MCELLGLCSREKIEVNDLLKAFYARSVNHPNGWGLAFFYGNAVSLEKEPLAAHESRYLKERLHHRIEADTMMAHIRLATRGTMEYENCHPFVHRDASDRTWTLMHNGTVFEGPQIDRYIDVQEGQTDSERILLHIVGEINRRMQEKGAPPDAGERFEVVSGIIAALSPRAKLNLMIYDGELFYTHTNYARSLYNAPVPGGRLFATSPLCEEIPWSLKWNCLPLNTVRAWRDGELAYQSTPHEHEYVDTEEDLKMLFADFAGL